MKAPLINECDASLIIYLLGILTELIFINLDALVFRRGTIFTVGICEISEVSPCLKCD